MTVFRFFGKVILASVALSLPAHGIVLGQPGECEDQQFHEVHQQVVDATKSKPNDTGYRFWHMRLWHGMTFSAWRQLIRKYGFKNVALRKRGYAFTITLTSLFNSLMARLDSGFMWNDLKAAELDHPPVFVLGHWRSGTTLLHELMNHDAEHSAPLLHHCFMPNSFMMTGPIQRKIASWFLPGTRAMDGMAVTMDKANEDEFALCNAGAPSSYSGLAFPQQMIEEPMYALDLTKLSPGEREKWETELKRFYHRVAYDQKGRLLMKSPTHTGRVGELSHLFPGAKFIHLSRRPEKIFQSTKHLWRSIFDAQRLGLDYEDERQLDEFVLSNLEVMYEAYERGIKEMHPESRLVEIRFEDFIKDPTGVIADAYGELGLEFTDETRKAITDDWQSRGKYKKNEFGELTPSQADEIKERWANYYDRFNY